MKNNFIKNLKYIRDDQKISQQYIADKIGVDRSTIGCWENGKADPSMSNVVKLAEVLDIDIVTLIGGNLSEDTTNQYKNKIIKVPILKEVKTEIHKNDMDNILGYTCIIKKETDEDNYFALKINNNDLAPKYSNNDIVAFEKLKDYQVVQNKDCLVMINNKPNIMNVTFDEDGMLLVPIKIANKNLPKHYNHKQIKELSIKILGIAIEKRTKL